MNRQQLHEIKEVYDMLEKGLTHPLKTTKAFLHIQPDANSDTPMRVKQNAIQRFMMLSYRDEYDAMTRKEKVDAILPPLVDSVGTVENLQQQTHKEEQPSTDLTDIQGFLTAEEKQSLSEPLAGTTLEIVSSDGKKKRTRLPNGQHKERTKVVKK